MVSIAYFPDESERGEFPIHQELASVSFDLRDRFGEKRLAEWSLRAAAGLEGLDKHKFSGMNGAECWGDYLAVLIYAYAAGIYESSEIERHLENDAVIRSLWSRPVMGGEAGELRRFRRRHYGVLARGLVAVFERAGEEGERTAGVSLFFCERGPSRLGGRAFPPFGLESRGSRGEVRPDYAAFAEVRIRNAIAVDSIALDD